MELQRVMREHEYNAGRAAAKFNTQMLRDLQVLSQLAWFDEDYLQNDRDIKALASKGRDYDLHDQALLGPKQTVAMRNALTVYKEFADRGQIELSASPYYHPILPLICDSNIAQTAHPYGPLPSQYSYPGDAEEQMRRSCLYFEEKFGRTPDGLWPPEGSVSDETFRLAARVGFRWTATDEGVLTRTLETDANASTTYRAYQWQQREFGIKVLFRDQRLSDLIGFVYARMDPAEAAGHFLQTVTNNSAPFLERGEDALVPIILDGENAWENYPENGRPFLRELYRQISEHPDIAAQTISEALVDLPTHPLDHVFPGSWIGSNFDTWIGAKEDNRAWELLLRARKKYDEVLSSPKASSITEKDKKTAWEELLIAEGSDWCWWYGPEHWSANRAEFDQLYRDHLSNVYRMLHEDVPADLAKRILEDGHAAVSELPSGMIQPTIDGKLSARKEWQNAGRHKIDTPPGAMHSHRPLAQDLYYGTDGQNIFLRLDLAERPTHGTGFTVRFKIRNAANESVELEVSADAIQFSEPYLELPEGSVTAAIEDFCEMRISMTALHIRRGDPIFLRLIIHRDGLPVAWLPSGGELELNCTPMTAFAY